MPNHHGDVLVSRRTFLRRVGVTASALAASHLLSACSGTSARSLAPNVDQAAKSISVHSSAAQQDTLRVGLLLPQSKIYPAIGANFRAGMDLYLAQHSSTDRPISLIAREYGTTPSVAIAQASDLISKGQADMIVGSLSSGIAATLHPLLHERQMPLLVSNIGANLTRDDRTSPYIMRNSFSYWQSNWALGRWAATNMGKQALVASSFYDSGYDSLYAFQLGFESAGGTITTTRVTHLPAESGDLQTLMADIRQTRPDLVFAAYSGAQATDFVRAYAHAGLSAIIPLLGSGFLTDESLLPQQADAALGIKTALPWARTLDLPTNDAFTSEFQNFSGRSADPFAVLGYDTAHMIAQCACIASSPAQLRQALSAAAFESPRGTIRMDETLLEINTPLYLREVRASASGPSNIVIDKLPALPPNNAGIAALRAVERTGWSNTYMAA